MENVVSELPELEVTPDITLSEWMQITPEPDTVTEQTCHCLLVNRRLTVCQWQTGEALVADLGLVPRLGHSLPTAWASGAQTAGLILGTSLELDKLRIGDRCVIDVLPSITHLSLHVSRLYSAEKCRITGKVIDGGEKTENFSCARARVKTVIQQGCNRAEPSKCRGSLLSFHSKL